MESNGDSMIPSHSTLKDLIRDGVSATIRSILPSVIHPVREEEFHLSLRDPAFKGPLVDVIRLELQHAIEELRQNGKSKATRKR